MPRRPLSVSASLGLLLIAGSAGPTWSSDQRHAHEAVATPGGDLDWIEVTVLEPQVVRAEAADRARRMGHDADEISKRSEQAWLAINTKADGGTTLEVWLSTTCEECLDLKAWSWSARLGRDGLVRSPRWVESEVVRQEVEVKEVLDAARTVTRSWVRGRLAFARSDWPSDGRVDLEIVRPERWAEAETLTWWRGLLTPAERVRAWLWWASP